MNLCVAVKILSKIWSIFHKTISHIRAKNKMLFYLKCSMGSYRRYMSKQGPSIDERGRR